MKTGLLVVFATILLSGCVQTHVSMLDNRTASISGLGGAVVSMDQVQQKVLLTAAEEARARGYEFFAVLGGQDASRNGVIFNQSAGVATPIVQPGQDVMVRFYHSDEINPKDPNIWNVESVLAAAKQG